MKRIANLLARFWRFVTQKPKCPNCDGQTLCEECQWWFEIR